MDDAVARWPSPLPCQTCPWPNTNSQTSSCTRLARRVLLRNRPGLVAVGTADFRRPKIRAAVADLAPIVATI